MRPLKMSQRIARTGSANRQSRRSERRRNTNYRPQIERLETRRVFAVNVGSDFDGDEKSDLAVWRPDNGTWYVRTSRTGFDTDWAIRKQWGAAGDIPLKNADFDGDEKADLAVYRPSNATWYVLTSSTGYDYNRAIRKQWGTAGDVPLHNSDFDGDGKTDMAVWRPSNGTWYALLSDSSYRSDQAMRIRWGVAGDVPLQNADFDGDEQTDIAVWRPRNGTWYVLKSREDYRSDRALRVRWGREGDVPLQNSDFDGDGATDMAIWRPSNGTWYVRQSSYGFGYNGSLRKQWGTGGDIPLENTDIDGDGSDDMALYRPSTGTFWVSTSLTGFADRFSKSFGVAEGATPIVGNDFDGDDRTDLVTFHDNQWTIKDSSLEFIATRSYVWGRSGDVPLSHTAHTDTRRVLYVNFDGARMSRSTLERWAEDWTWGADGSGSKIDGDGDGITVDPYLEGESNREQVIRRIITLLQEDLLPFGFTVQRIDGLAPERQGATTLFYGNADLTGGAHIAYDIDYGNDNSIDVGFVAEERWAQDAWGVWDTILGDSYSVSGTALAMADVGLHEAGHTFGLEHVDSGTANETMGIRYNNSYDKWVANTRFLDRDYDKLDSGGKQNSFETMVSWAGSGFSTGAAAPFAMHRSEGSLDHDHDLDLDLDLDCFEHRVEETERPRDHARLAAIDRVHQRWKQSDLDNGRFRGLDANPSLEQTDVSKPSLRRLTSAATNERLRGVTDLLRLRQHEVRSASSDGEAVDQFMENGVQLGSLPA